MEQVIHLPKMGLTMEEATLIRRLAQSGESLNKGDIIAEVETDKAVLEIEMPQDGVIGEWLAAEGELLQVGAPLAKIAVPDHHQTIESVKTVDAGGAVGTFLPISPSARRKAKELGVDYTQISGTGPKGRIIHADIMDSMNHSNESAASNTVLVAGLTLDQQALQHCEKHVSLSGMRRTIAKRMVESVTTIPQFYLKKRVDVTKINELKAVLQISGERSFQVKLSFNDFVIRAVAEALVAHPEINASFRGTPESKDSYIVQYEEVNIGLAVAAKEGLFVPVIHKANKLSLMEIASHRAQQIQSIREGSFKMEDLQGGTFTVSSLGTMGVEEFTAIINPPEAGILTVGSIVEEPVVRNKSIEIRPMVTIVGSFDHRVIDGALAAAFMNTVVKQMESDTWVLF